MILKWISTRGPILYIQRMIYRLNAKHSKTITQMYAFRLKSSEVLVKLSLLDKFWEENDPTCLQSFWYVHIFNVRRCVVYLKFLNHFLVYGGVCDLQVRIFLKNVSFSIMLLCTAKVYREFRICSLITNHINTKAFFLLDKYTVCSICKEYFLYDTQ